MQPSSASLRQDDAATWLPSFDDAARATLIGAVALAVTNIIAVSVLLPWPGLWWRLQHHFFDLIELLALGVGLATPLWLAARREWKRSGLVWLAYTALCCACMHGLMQAQLRRVVWALLDGGASVLLFALMVGACGCVVPLGYAFGTWLSRGARRGVGLALSVGVMALGHVVLPDDYQGVHAAVFWVAACVFGATLTPSLDIPQVTRSRLLWGVLGAAVLGVSWSPPNRVRQALFREAGSVAPWIFAKLVWSMPGADAEPDRFEAPKHDAELWRRAALPIEAPVVVLLTIDALRADVVHDKANDARFPNLARLRDSGTSFTRASSPGSQTVVSLTALHAGRYGSQRSQQRWPFPMSSDGVRFAAELGRAGVSTHNIVGLAFLREHMGIARGFAHERLVVESEGHAVAEKIMIPLLDGIRAHGDGAALFYSHLMDPHEPYDRGALKTGSDWERYLSEIEVVDAWLGKLIDAMSTHHPDRGIIILSADHGEAFGEHGTKYHAKTLYEELIHVPLFMWGATIAARRVDTRVSLIDIAPTLHHLFGIEPHPDYRGESLLLSMLGKDAPAPRRPVMAEGRGKYALHTRDGLKVIEDRRLKVVEIYDLAADPKELHNLFDPDDARMARAVATLRALL